MRLIGVVLLRALLSTVIICSVALVSVAPRLPHANVAALKQIAARYWPVAIVVFLGISVWEFWSRQTAGARVPKLER